MNEELRNTIPDEEQQLYIDAKLALDELDRKIVVEDEDYQNMLNEVNSTTDLEQREKLTQYLERYISVSEYNRLRTENLAWVNEINERYGLDESANLYFEGTRARQQLTRLRNYYRRRNMDVLENLRIETLSDEEAIREYTNYTAGIEPYVLREMLNDDITSRLGRKSSKPDGGTGNGSSENGPVSKTDEEKIQEKIEKFKSDSDKMKAEIDKVKVELVLGEGNRGFDLTDAVRGLETELGELANEAEELKTEIDDFVRETGSADFSMTPAQIEKSVNELKRRVKDLKQTLVSKYDARVAMTNAKIAELKSKTDLEPEIQILVDGLEELPICGVTVKNWKHNNFFSVIDFDKLVEVNKNIYNIENKSISPLPQLPSDEDASKTENTENGNNEQPPVEDNGLEADILYIEGEIERQEMEIAADLSKDDVNRINQDLQVIADNINNFRLKLESNRDSLTDEEYNNYIARIEDAQANLAHLYGQLKSKSNSEDEKNQDYDELVERANKISVNVDKLVDDVTAFHGKITDGGKLVFEGRISEIEKDLSDLKNDIETKHNEGKIDENRYNSLIEKINGMEQKVVAAKNELKEADYIKDADIFAVLNGEVDGLEQALTNLEEQIEKLQKPIKREDRKDIDRIFKHIEQEIARIEKFIEKYKESEPEKYNKLVDRLNGLKDRLDKVGKKYRDKCPLFVKGIKSAKNFFKKHKKACLIVAGLAAMALVSYHVLIPAIMHGNIMIAGTTPTLRPFMKFTNKILGGMIGAEQKLSDGVMCWFLSNGVRINPSCAASSLLKGLAISGINSTLLVAPLVVAIKKLVDKMKTTELKQKLSESISNGKEKIDGMAKGAKDKINGKLKKKKNIEELIEEFKKSGKSVAEFVKENKLSAKEELELYRALAIGVQKENEVQEESVGIVRR